MGAARISDDVQALSPGKRAPAHARRLVRVACSHWPSEQQDVAVVLTSELVTNALLHGTGPISLRVTCDGDFLLVEVFDRGEAAVRLQSDAGPSVESGRGLTIVESLADSWGTQPLQGRPGKSVWFELRAHSGRHSE